MCGHRAATKSVTTPTYPLFLAAREQDVEAWEKFFESFDVPTAIEEQPRDKFAGPLYIVLDLQPSLEIEHVEGYPVISRTETIEYMHEHYAQFQSALSMLETCSYRAIIDLGKFQKQSVFTIRITRQRPVVTILGGHESFFLETTQSRF